MRDFFRKNIEWGEQSIKEWGEDKDSGQLPISAHDESGARRGVGHTPQNICAALKELQVLIILAFPLAFHKNKSKNYIRMYISHRASMPQEFKHTET